MDYSALSEPKNLLVVDDDPSVCQVMAAMLKDRGYDVVTETNGRKVLGLLQQGEFDVALIDLVMPAISGLELIDQIRQHDRVMPILVVTGLSSAENTVAAMRHGATDFVTKPVDSAFLDLRIRGAWDLARAHRLANTDGLTGLYNHRHLQERLREELDRARRYRRPLSLVMADLDHFKTYNDTYGHPQGDEVLMAVAHTLRQVSRTSDLVARYGGEEFTLVLPETSLEDAQTVAERARQCVAALEFQGRENSHVTGVTLSLGIASYYHGCTQEELIALADAALYEAKRAGRNRVRVAMTEADRKNSEKETAEIELPFT